MTPPIGMVRSCGCPPDNCSSECLASWESLVATPHEEGEKPLLFKCPVCLSDGIGFFSVDLIRAELKRIKGVLLELHDSDIADKKELHNDRDAINRYWTARQAVEALAREAAEERARKAAV